MKFQSWTGKKIPIEWVVAITKPPSADIDAVFNPHFLNWAYDNPFNMDDCSSLYIAHRSNRSIPDVFASIPFSSQFAMRYSKVNERLNERGERMREVREYK